ncbi:MAG: ABC transporter substrate-binding protein [Negativicutes bacterium]|nr:ABC transporter substrate-binding protein [Negativicutes bacterium]
MAKRKGFLVALGLLMIAIMVVATGCGGSSTGSDSQKKVAEVKIGGLWPLSGGASTIGNQCKDGMEYAIEEINRNGGIKSMGGAKMVPVWADTQSKPDVGVSQADRLLSKEGVKLLLGAYQSGVTFPVTDVAERYGIPMLVNGAVKNEITERKYKNVFRICNKASYDVNEMAQSLADFSKVTGQTVKTIGIIYDSSDWGADTARILRERVKELNWEIVMDEPVTTGQTDLSPSILKLKNASPDVVFLALYTPEHILFNKTFAANKVDLRFGIMSVGAGSEDPAFYKAVPDAMTEYIFVQDDWDTGGPAREEWKGQLAKACKEKYGYDMMTYWAQGYVTAYVAKEALEKAGSTDPEALRKALAGIDISSGPAMLLGYQRIKFDENGQNTFAHGTISQRQKGQRVVLWPDANKTPGGKVILPVPTWAER